MFKTKKNKNSITKQEGTAYAKVALHFLQVLHIKVTPENLEDQMLLVYDLYETLEVVKEAKKY